MECNKFPTITLATNRSRVALGMVALYSKWVAWQLLSSASIIQLTKRRRAVLVRFCPGPMFRHTRTQSSKSSELCQVDYWLPVGAFDCMYSLSLYGDLQCQCVRCHKKIAIFRCMPLDSKHRLLNSAYYSRESLELLQFFILQYSSTPATIATNHHHFSHFARCAHNHK